MKEGPWIDLAFPQPQEVGLVEVLAVQRAASRIIEGPIEPPHQAAILQELSAACAADMAARWMIPVEGHPTKVVDLGHDDGFKILLLLPDEGDTPRIQPLNGFKLLVGPTIVFGIDEERLPLSFKEPRLANAKSPRDAGEFVQARRNALQ